MQEALIGVLFVSAASAEILLLAHDPHGGEHLKDLLVGQILWVSPTDLLPVALLYGAVLALWFRVGERLGRLGFYLLFAATVTASVQLVGIYLVFGSLIVPALAACAFAERYRLAAGYAAGTTFHPTFLYESLGCLAIAWLLVRIEKRTEPARGRLFLVYVAMYTAMRFFIEGLRIDPARHAGSLRLKIGRAHV